jgi:glyoxylase-like metal-dependent hydrolase (beta-lactamase superfamily II)
VSTTRRETPPEVRPFRRRPEEASATPVGDGVVALTLPLGYSPTADVNCFLLELDDGWCLVDTGSALAPGWDGLAHALAQAEVPPEAIALLVVTHPHEDHYALAAEVLARTGAELALAPGPLASADVLRDPVIARAERLESCRRAGVPSPLTEAAACHPGGVGDHPRPGPDRVLRDGDELATRHGPWRVLPAPGHAPAHIVLHDERRGRLLSADLVLGGRIPYLEHGYTPDPWAEQVASLERAAGLGVELLLPGHGPPETDVEPRIASALGAVRAAPERVLRVLGEEPRTAYGTTLAVLGPRTTFYRRHAALSGALCVLERLVAEGVAQAWSDDDGVRWYAAGAS